MTWNAPQNGTRTPNHGETWVSMIEFAPEGTRALGLMSYGNATQPGSPHKTDQLQMLSDSALRPLPLRRAEVRRLAVERERY
jgi:acyl-homoserine-lactone acylase